MFARHKRRDGLTYVQLARSYRKNGKPTHAVFANLGRLDHLIASGKYDNLLRSMSRFSDKLKFIDVDQKVVEARSDLLCLGPTMVFEKLWNEQKLPAMLRKLVRGRRFNFDVERAAFTMALHSLCEPGCDLQFSKWLAGMYGEGFADLQLEHFYRTCKFLHEVRDDLETQLFQRERNLFDDGLEMLFVDTTSLYIDNDDEHSDYLKHGYSRDKRPDLLQVILCVAVDKRGWPVAWQILPGNTADSKAMSQLAMRLRRRFGLRRVTVVGDRGMISANNISLFEDNEDNEDKPYDYILGCKMRKQREVNEEVLSRAGRFREVAPNLDVKEVMVGPRRYIVCRNQHEVRRDARVREEMLSKLVAKIEEGASKSMIRNSGYRRFIKLGKGAMSIDSEAVERDARLDGKFVLRTNRQMEAEEVALAYKDLWRVERMFRLKRSVLEVRPIHHHSNEVRIGHIVSSILALRLEVDMQRRMEERRVKVPWQEMMMELKRLQIGEIKIEGMEFEYRSKMTEVMKEAFQAVGINENSQYTLLGEDNTGESRKAEIL